MTFLHSNLAHILAGVAFMGSWAFVANLGHPWPAPLLAGLVQSLITGTVTLFMKRAIEWTARRTVGLLPPTLTASAISASFLTVMHTAAQTPAFWLTVVVPFSVATIYGATYTLTLRRLAQIATVPPTSAPRTNENRAR
jgi:phosphoglycerol transferase MdoB-like AlkP superfamily enzyme